MDLHAVITIATAIIVAAQLVSHCHLVSMISSGNSGTPPKAA